MEVKWKYLNITIHALTSDIILSNFLSDMTTTLDISVQGVEDLTISQLQLN